MALPSILGVRRANPRASFRLITTSEASPFAEALGIFDEIVIIDDGSFIRLMVSSYRALRKAFRGDVFVELELYSRLSTVFASLTFSRLSISFFLPQVKARRRLCDLALYFNPMRPIFEHYDLLPKIFGSHPATSAEAQMHLRCALNIRSSDVPKDSLGVAIGCSGFGSERRRPSAEWRRSLLSWVSAHPQGSVTFFGAESEHRESQDLIDFITSQYPTIRTMNFCGRLSLSDSLRELGGVHEFWSIDSGLLHFGRLLCSRVHSFWGPTDPALRLRRVDGLIEVQFYSRVSCSPCIHVAEEAPCNGRNICMQVSEGVVSPPLALLNATQGRIGEKLFILKNS